MTIREAMKEKHLSVYRLARNSELPYATVNDICNEKSRLEKCSAETVFRLARALEVSMESLIAPCLVKRSSFDNFKSSVCHRVKEMGDVAFLIDLLESQEIRTYYDRKWYPESLYLLAMLDYLSRENDLPLCSDYDDLRKCKLEKPVYPAGIRALSVASNSDTVMSDARNTAIPEFMRFNIVENEVRNVI